LKLSDGLVIISEIKDVSLEMPEYPKKYEDHLFSEKFSCPVDNIQIPEIEPRTFSFNSPHGACSTCSGIGKILKVDSNLIVSPELSIKEGGFLPFSNIFEHDTWYSRVILKVCSENEIDVNLPIKNLSQEQKNLLLFGTGSKTYKVDGTNRFGRFTSIFETFRGFINELEKRHSETQSDWVRFEIEKYMREKICPSCNGTRLKKEALGITISGLSISEFTAFSIENAFNWLNDLLKETSILSEREKSISKLILNEILTRLGFLLSIGLEYITLDRQAGSLSGGESQRIRLASQIGSGLTGVLYVLDEPTIGLHPKDNQKLIDTLKNLRDLGNTVIVVEHDEVMMRKSDYIFDFGPGAGKKGGEVVAEGTATKLSENPKSITGQYLSGRKKINIIIPQYKPRGLLESAHAEINIQNYKLTLYGCSQYNLKNIIVTFPLGKFVVITGVSGSGKSTLLVETLYPAIVSKFNSKYRGNIGLHKSLEGIEYIDKIILIDQSPIGRTPRSNPATYTKLFDEIREVFAQTHDARAAGFRKGRFSFNVKGGRCETCEGQGHIKIEMQFMSDLWITCDVCQGTRYNSQTLEINYKGKTIADVLGLTVDEAMEFFHNNPKILAKLKTLSEVGLGYIELGQPATTLSGGEAQRVKLSSELGKKATGRTIYILDEPTTGLHFADVAKLITVLKTLVSYGNSVFIIEHNLDVIKNADYIIDLGPEGGDKGGEIIAEGAPKDIIKNTDSYTAQYLSKIIK
jgi:excinuclease ABC subunit A